MASELATGILVRKEISLSGEKIAMLVREQSGVFTKKARGKICFVCENGSLVKTAVKEAIKTGESQEFVMVAEGFDESRTSVSKFTYRWSIKRKPEENTLSTF